METTKETKGFSPLLLARILMVVAAVALVGAFFLPWASGTEEFREGAQLAPDFMFYEPTGLTAGDAVDLSLLEYAQVYGTMGSGWEIYSVIMYGVLGVSAFALLLAALSKPIGASVFGVIAFAGSRLLVWDFEDRAVLPNSSFDWGIASTIYLVAFVVLLGAVVWMVIEKRKAKAQKSAA